MIHLDTHVVCWLYAGNIERLSVAAREAIEGAALAISPMVELEIRYLVEIGRFRGSAEAVVAALANDLGLMVSQAAFSRVVDAAIGLVWTRDVFDRLIVAQAMADGAMLVTKDERIRANFSQAVW